MPPDTDCAHAIIHSGITVVKYAKFYNKESKEILLLWNTDIFLC